MQNGTEGTKFVPIFRTGKLYEADLVVNTLRERDIPFYRQEQLASGLRFAFPAQPAPGPGVWWAIFVPEQNAGEATDVLSELPIEMTTEPDIWHFGPSEKMKSAWRLFVWILLSLNALMFLSNLLTGLTPCFR